MVVELKLKSKINMIEKNNIDGDKILLKTKTRLTFQKYLRLAREFFTFFGVSWGSWKSVIN